MNIEISKDSAENDAQIDVLMKAAFGPGRFVKAAHFLRLGNVPDYELSRVALKDGELIGACRIWPVEISDGEMAHFLGPIVIAPNAQGLGLGSKLVQECLEAIEKTDNNKVILIGDMAFFEKFGFSPLSGEIGLPLPAIKSRILGLNFAHRADIGLISRPQNTN